MLTQCSLQVARSAQGGGEGGGRRESAEGLTTETFSCQKQACDLTVEIGMVGLFSH